MSSPLDPGSFEVLTFDCYGTLIDWEAGLLGTMRPLLQDVAPQATDDELLERYAEREARLEAGPWLPYRQVLAQSVAEVSGSYGRQLDAAEMERVGASVADWPPFADSRAALESLSARYRLAVITNCDDDLFAASEARLGMPFTWVITAEQARAYKPDRRPFELALRRIGIPRERVLHIAQSLYHDHVPAREMGLATLWVNRRGDKPGFGATPPAETTPDLEMRDMGAVAAALSVQDGST